VRAVEVLKRADIVFHDALVHPGTLALAGRARKVAVGKRSGRRSTAQRFINKQLVDAARTFIVSRLGPLISEAGDRAADASFTRVTRALDHLYYLHRYDEGVGGQSRLEVAALLTEAYARALWLLEAQAPTADAETLRGLRALLHAVHTAGEALAWDRTELLAALHRLGAATDTPPLLRGAAAGMLWSLGASDLTVILRQLPASPETLGDFLRGVFALAREESQRHADLLVAVDGLLLAYDDEQFLVALPALRLAFTYFTPREKDHLARRLLAAVGQAGASPLPALAVSADEAARALRFESRLLRELGRHGLRGGTPSS